MYWTEEVPEGIGASLQCTAFYLLFSHIISHHRFLVLVLVLTEIEVLVSGCYCSNVSTQRHSS